MNEKEKLSKDFEDLQKRVNISSPSKLVTKRVIEELSVPDNKYRLFTRYS